MNKLGKYENILQPAIYVNSEASGMERKPCLLCGEGFTKKERLVEMYGGSYKSHTNYSGRFHYRCFLKVIINNFMMELSNKEIKDLKEEIIKEVVMEKLK